MAFKDPEKQRAYQREWLKRRRAEWLDGKSCVDCGSFEALEVDHVDQGEKISHNVWSWSTERREAELAKCEVRCRPCHVLKGQLVGDLGSGQRRLTSAEVQEIKARYASGGVTQQDLADEYGTVQQHISKLVLDQRRVWV